MTTDALFAAPSPPETGLLQIRPIGSHPAKLAVIEHHYLHRAPPISHAYGLYRQHWLVGVVTLGTPPSRHLQLSACRTEPAAVIELNRLWVHDTQPRNTESWFVSRVLKQLPAHIVVSFADTKQGHYGYIYRALNFHYAGWTDMERKSARWDYIPVNPQLHSRAAYRGGYTHRTQRQTKIRYWTTTGNRTDKQRLNRLCTWPSLNWHSTPPPGEP